METRMMGSLEEVWMMAAEMSAELRHIGALGEEGGPTGGVDSSRFDDLVMDAELREKTRRLFLDGHYARSVEEA